MGFGTIVFGLVVGLIFFLGGIGWLINGIRDIWRWLRTRRGGVVVEAQILDRQATHDNSDAPPTYYGTLRWLYGSGEHTSELQIPERWYQSPEGEPVPIRIHPDRPAKATIEHWSANPAWKLLGVIFGMVALFVGLALLGFATSEACNPVQYDVFTPACDFLRDLFT